MKYKLTEKMEDEIEQICYDIESQKLDWTQASERLLFLCGVSEQSELFFQQQRELLLESYKEGFQAAVDSLVSVNEL